MVGPVVDTVIGLSFVFLLTALMVTACVEGVAAVTKKRAKWLLRGLQQLLGGTAPGGSQRQAENKLYDAALAASTPDETTPQAAGTSWLPDVIAHPLIQTLAQTKATDSKATRFPSSIPSSAFARALLEKVVGEAELNIEIVRAAVNNAEADIPAPVRNALKSILKTLPEQTVASLQRSIEDWFNAQMKSVGEAYRRWTKRWAIVIGIAVAIGLNVSTVAVAHALYVDEPLREATVAAATSGSLCQDEGAPGEVRTCVDTRLSELAADGLPVGWDLGPIKGWDWLWFVLGWVLTGLAASFGAPFWYDALKRLSGLRANVSTTGATT